MECWMILDEVYKKNIREIFLRICKKFWRKCFNNFSKIRWEGLQKFDIKFRLKFQQLIPSLRLVTFLHNNKNFSTNGNSGFFKIMFIAFDPFRVILQTSKQLKFVFSTVKSSKIITICYLPIAKYCSIERSCPPNVIVSLFSLFGGQWLPKSEG